MSAFLFHLIQPTKTNKMKMTELEKYIRNEFKKFINTNVDA